MGLHSHILLAFKAKINGNDIASGKKDGPASSYSRMSSSGFNLVGRRMEKALKAGNTRGR